MENTDITAKSKMFKYIGKNNTLYDILGKYYPELNGDYSTASFLNNINPEYVDERLYGQYNIYEIYNELIDKLIRVIRDFNNGQTTKISQEQYDELLKKFQEGDSEDYLDTFDTVEEYLEFIKYNLKDPSARKIREVAIVAALKYPSYTRAENLKYRGLPVQLHVNAIKRKINEKYKSEPHDENAKNRELEEFEVIRSILGNLENMEQYDQYLTRNKENKQKKVATIHEIIKELQRRCEELENKQDISDRCQEYRKAIVETRIKKSLSEKQKMQLKAEKANGRQADIMSVVLGDYKTYLIPDKDTFEWEFREFKEPQVILNTLADYAEDEVENQRVIAVSYGFLNYRTGFTKEGMKNGSSRATNGSSYELELIGVTRKGVDGDSTYFVFTSFDNARLMSETEISQNRDSVLMNYVITRKNEDSLLGRIVNRTLKTEEYENSENESFPIYDKLTGERMYLVKTTRRIPEELEEYYAKIFFSDIYLDAIQKAYSGYAGVVDNNYGNPRIIQEFPLQFGEKSPEYIRAIKYAKIFPTTYKDDPAFTLKKYIESDEIKQKQKRIVEMAIEKDKKITVAPEAPGENSSSTNNFNLDDSALNEDGPSL